MSFDIGARCWYPSKEFGWIAAEVTNNEFKENIYHLELKLEDGGIISLDSKDPPEKMINSTNVSSKNEFPVLRNPPILEAIDDLTALSYLNEPAVLHAIKERYNNKNIYTYSGIVLIATNPFDKVDELYSQEMIHKYSTQNKLDLEPHIFAIADEAYTKMIEEKQNQTIVVSGESGAGKTVSAKFIMRYLASIEPELSHNDSQHKEQARMTEIEKKILATNPILEAFGNAKTTRNDNSSRFGKYLEIQFDDRTKIVGAKIRSYLLERSRLVFQPDTERNYHIFYQMLQGLPEEQKIKFSLTDGSDFNYMNQGAEYNLEGIDEQQEFKNTTEALQLIGINSDVQAQLFQILAALLHIGNIEITKTRNDTSLSSDEPNLKLASQLLGIDASNFGKWIIKKQIKTRMESIVSNLNYNQAIVSRDSIAKFIYSTLFDYIVDNINQVLADSDDNNEIKSFIGVLDIYGFEHFERNSFEQFCINYANEKLQQEFNQHVFKLEQEEYIRENIEWSFIEFNDNQPCIDLIENKLGILTLLDEESILPAGSDETWIEKLYQTFDKPPTNQVFAKPRFGQTKFVVSHYAQDVAYDVEGFIEKNRDTISDDVFETLKATTNETLKLILDNLIEKQEISEQAKRDEENKAGIVAKRNIQKKPTLGSMFKKSLIELMNTIQSTNVHYIRCIKPNSDKEAWGFDNLQVLSQLRACGVLETIKISCSGFPSRWTFDEFIQRYYFLAQPDEWTPLFSNKNVDKEAIVSFSRSILENIINDKAKYQIGDTKIFFKAGMLAYLENQRSDKLSKASVIIQKKIRALYYRKLYLKTMSAIRKCQNIVRGKLIRDRIVFELKTNASTFIQSYIRGYSTSKKYRDILANTLRIQSIVRQRLAKLQVERMIKERASIVIQTKLRSHIKSIHYTMLKSSSVTIQSFIRKTTAQREYKKQLDEYNSVDREIIALKQKFTAYMENLFSILVNNKTAIDLLNSYQNKNANETLNTLLGDESTFESLLATKNEINEKSGDINKLISNYSSWKDIIKNIIRSLDNLEHESANKTELLGLNDQMKEMDKELLLLRKIVSNNNAKEGSDIPLDLGISKPDELNTNFSLTVENPNELSSLLDESASLEQEVTNLLSKISECLHNQEPITIPRLPSQVIILVLTSYFKVGQYKEGIKFVEENVSVIHEIFNTFRRDELIRNGIFWISNIFEIYHSIASFNVKSQTTSLSQIQQEYSSLLSICYDNWLKKTTETIRHKYAISRTLLGSNNQVSENSAPLAKNNEYLINLLSYLDDIYDGLKNVCLPAVIIKNIFSSILSFIDITCFNDLLNKSYELSWKVGLTIDKNVGGLTKWLESKDLIRDLGLECCPYISQTSKLLQLRIANLQDFKIVSEFCYLLNPLQLQYLLKKYKPGKHEAPIPVEVLNFLANSQKERRTNDVLSLPDDVKHLENPFTTATAKYSNETKINEELDAFDLPILKKIVVLVQ